MGNNGNKNNPQKQNLLEACKKNIGEWVCTYCNSGSGQPFLLKKKQHSTPITSSPWYESILKSPNSQRRLSESSWRRCMCTRLKRSMGIECNASKLYTTASVSSPCRTQQKTKKRHSRYENDYAEFFKDYKSLIPSTKWWGVFCL